MAILRQEARGHNADGEQTFVGTVETVADLSNPILTVGSEELVLEDESTRIKKSDGSWKELESALRTTAGVSF